MTLKVHVILDHYMWYFKEMRKNFHETNGEFVEAVHYSLDGHEDKHKFKVTRNIGTDEPYHFQLFESWFSQPNNEYQEKESQFASRSPARPK